MNRIGGSSILIETQDRRRLMCLFKSATCRLKQDLFIIDAIISNLLVFVSFDMGQGPSDGNRIPYHWTFPLLSFCSISSLSILCSRMVFLNFKFGTVPAERIPFKRSSVYNLILLDYFLGETVYKIPFVFSCLYKWMHGDERKEKLADDTVLECFLTWNIIWSRKTPSRNFL